MPPNMHKAYRFYRVIVTKTVGGQHALIGELKMFESNDLTGTSFLSGGIATASSTFNATTHNPSNAIDGVPSNEWASETRTATVAAPHWLQIEIPSAKVCRSFSIQSTAPDYQQCEKIYLAGSNDGVNWEKFYYSDNFLKLPGIRNIPLTTYISGVAIQKNNIVPSIAIMKWNLGETPVWAGEGFSDNLGNWFFYVEPEDVNDYMIIYKPKTQGYRPAADGPVNIKVV